MHKLNLSANIQLRLIFSSRLQGHLHSGMTEILLCLLPSAKERENQEMIEESSTHRSYWLCSAAHAPRRTLLHRDTDGGLADFHTSGHKFPISGSHQNLSRGRKSIHNHVHRHIMNVISLSGEVYKKIGRRNLRHAFSQQKNPKTL